MSGYDLIVAGVLGGMAFAFGVGALVILVVALVRLFTAADVDELEMAEVIALADRESRQRDLDGAA